MGRQATSQKIFTRTSRFQLGRRAPERVGRQAHDDARKRTRNAPSPRRARPRLPPTRCSTIWCTCTCCPVRRAAPTPTSCRSSPSFAKTTGCTSTPQPPGVTISNEILGRNRAVLERRLRDLGLLIGVNDAERMKRLTPRFEARRRQCDVAWTALHGTLLGPSPFPSVCSAGPSVGAMAFVRCLAPERGGRNWPSTRPSPRMGGGCCAWRIRTTRAEQNDRRGHRGRAARDQGRCDAAAGRHRAAPAPAWTASTTPPARCTKPSCSRRPAGSRAAEVTSRLSSAPPCDYARARNPPCAGRRDATTASRPGWSSTFCAASPRTGGIPASTCTCSVCGPSPPSDGRRRRWGARRLAPVRGSPARRRRRPPHRPCTYRFAPDRGDRGAAP